MDGECFAGLGSWSWRLSDCCRTDDYELLASEIQDKTPDDVARYYPVFKKKWKELAEHPRIKARIEEGEAKRNKRSNLEALLAKKIASVRYPMQELELNYPTTKGKVYSEEEDRYLLCRLNHYGMQAEDVYERIKKDITEFPVFRFDWFFKSRSPQELQRRCNTLLGMIEKESEGKQAEEVKPKGTKGKVCSCFYLSHPDDCLPSRGVRVDAVSCGCAAWTDFDTLQKRGIEQVQEAEKAEASRSSTPASASAASKRGAKKRRT